MQKRNHTSTEETIWISHLEKVSIFGLCKDAEINSCDVLVSCVYNGAAILHELKSCEFPECFFSKLVLNLLFSPSAFLFNVEPNEVDVVFCLPTCEARDTVQYQLQFKFVFRDVLTRLSWSAEGEVPLLLKS